MSIIFEVEIRNRINWLRVDLANSSHGDYQYYKLTQDINSFSSLFKATCLVMYTSELNAENQIRKG